MKRDSFTKAVTGEQLVRAVDSIAANIAEDYGRYFYKDRKQFCYYSRGLLLETKTWLKKAYSRKLISDNEYEDIIQQLKHCILN